MDTQQDPHHPRDLDHVEEPLDGASQSLADALRASFSALKGIMLVLVVLYLFSNVRTIGSHEQALVLRLGECLDEVHEAGLVWAFPFPLDEIVPLPTRKSNDVLIDSHTFHRREEEIGKPLSFISRGPNRGLNPVRDGALLTADAGLVHTRWKVTYKFDDVRGFVSRIAGDKVEASERLIRTLVETIGVHVAIELTAEEAIRTRVDFVQEEMKRRINARLSELASGLTVTLVEMYEPTPPIQVRQAFEGTQRAESAKQKRIRDAEKDRTRTLSDAAGAVYPRLVRLLGTIDRGGTDQESVAAARKELDRMLEEELEGEAGKRIKEAGAYRATVVSRMENDVRWYGTLVPEYRRNPMMLINRLWEETKQEIFSNAGVTKFYRPPGLKEFRIKIPLDPEHARVEETRRLQEKEFDPRKLREERWVPVGPRE